MNVLGALLLMLVMYIVIPVGVCAAALVALGGSERFLPPAMRARATTRREEHTEH